MATGYIPLPAARAPTNAMLDFSGIRDAIDSKHRYDMNKQNAMLAQRADERAQASHGMAQERMGMARTQFQQGQEDRQREIFAKRALAAYQEQDPAKRAQIWQSVIGRHPGRGNLDQTYLDPTTGPQQALAEAGMLPDNSKQHMANAEWDRRQGIERGYALEDRDAANQEWRQRQEIQRKDPAYQLDLDYKRSQIAKNQQKSDPASPTNVPTAVRTQAIKADQAYRNLIPALDSFAELVGRTGAVALPGRDNDAVIQARRNIQLQLKELYNLGVLNGPDLELMDRMVFDPSVNVFNPGDWPNAYDTAGRAKQSIEQLKSMLVNMRNNQTSVIGLPAVADPSKKVMGSPLPADNKPVQISGDEDYAKLPSGAVFVGPDGKQRVKP